ncbi:head-tail adaptor protein [Pseudomonas weihenstephanensis]|uniref:Head-tail adaptor protein n=1 Tax=Pseudomonas weihenstephanensis TaxID=1608994 RepID=A0A0J6IES5_9PSED|nr:phage head closure protein [Pseudomonas weihenstephanensis]KMN10194.1 head-tail adaptor protein [Pseudomonas weihenstephanensis]
MKAGRLRHRVDIQSKVSGQDPVTGEVIEGQWVTVWARCPAAVEPLSARDLYAAQAAQSEAIARITIRYRKGVLPAMRILHRDKVYSIVGQPLADAQSGLEHLTLQVTTGVNDG